MANVETAIEISGEKDTGLTPSGLLARTSRYRSGHELLPCKRTNAAMLHQEHGHESWQHRVHEFIESKKVQHLLSFLLFIDIVIICVELLLDSHYPSCTIIERDAISCCLDTDNEHRFLEGLLSDNNNEQHSNSSEHHSVCDSEYYEGESSCDPHKWPLLHMVHSILFYVSVAILIIFEVELLTLLAILKRDFFKGILHVLDLLVVTMSLVIEIATHNTGVGALIIFRIWRFIRVGHGLYMTEENIHKEEQGHVEKYVSELQEILKENNIEIPNIKGMHEEAS